MSPGTRFTILIATFCSALLGQSTVAYVAGGATWTFPVNATIPNVPFYNVNAAIVDGQGNTYVASGSDFVSGQVYKISSSGAVSVYAGSLKPSGPGEGDGGPAPQAAVNNPVSLALDSSGNLYIAEYYSRRIRKVAPNGIISTAVNGFSTGPTGVAVDSAGTIYVAEPSGNRVWKVSGNNALQIAAPGLANPLAVAVDASGNLYITDSGNGCIRKVPAGSTGNGTSVAGVCGQAGSSSGDGGAATSAHLSEPYGLFVDSAGEIFIADFQANTVRKVSASGTITTIAGGGTALGDGGPATSAQLSNPSSVTLDASGNVLISDTGNSRVRRVTPNGTISTFAGNGRYDMSPDGTPSAQATIATNDWVFDSSGNLFFTDNHQVRKVSAGVLSTIAGTGIGGFSGDGGPALAAQLDYPGALAIDASGNIFVSDTVNNRIRKITPSGVISTFASVAGSYMIFDTAGNLYLSTSFQALPTDCQILQISPSGTVTKIAGTGNCDSFSVDGTSATQASLGNPEQLAFDAGGNLLFAEPLNDRIRKISSGVITTVVGGGTAFGDGGPATSAELNRPDGVVVDAAGNIFVADGGNLLIREVSAATGKISTIATNNHTTLPNTGGVALPSDTTPVFLTLDAGGNLYVGDQMGLIKITGIAAPTPASPTFTNAASFATGAIAPGSLISIFGTNLAAQTASASGVPLPTTLGGTQLAFNGVAAPLLYVSPTQVNALYPQSQAAPGATVPSALTVATAAGTFAGTGPQTILSTTASPGIFTTNAQGQGAITDADGVILDSANPAAAGQVIVIYCTGLGAVSPQVAAGSGAPSNPPATITDTTLQVTIGGKAASVQFAGLTPTFVGLYQVNVVVPSGVQTGNAIPVVIKEESSSSNTATIAIH